MDRNERVLRVATDLLSAAIASGKVELGAVTNGDINRATETALALTNRVREAIHTETFGG